MEAGISDRVFEALDRLARSRWGMQGVGACPNATIWVELVHQGWARPVIGQPKKILAITLRGFRVLEEERHSRKK